ncbi:MAG: hypothetical protein WAM60_13590 [Candidatus Promineifilaceae bacterium]
MSGELINIACMGGLGLFVLVGGILARLGIYKSLYAMKSNPAFAPTPLAYTLIPGSILFFLFAVVPLWPTIEARRNFFFYGILPYQVLLILLAVLRPNWLKPRWLRWLEQEHDNIIELLWEDVRDDRWGWERRVRTQEQMEEWVASVQNRHKWAEKLEKEANASGTIKYRKPG